MLVAVTLVSVRLFPVLQGEILEDSLLQHGQTMSTVKEMSDNLCAKPEIENGRSEVLGIKEGLSCDGIIFNRLLLSHGEVHHWFVFGFCFCLGSFFFFCFICFLFFGWFFFYLVCVWCFFFWCALFCFAFFWLLFLVVFLFCFGLRVFC